MTQDLRLIDLFLPHLDDAIRERFAGAPDLSDALADALARASEPWPQIRLSAGVFLAFLARHIPLDSPGAAELPRMRLGDLYLLCAYSRGDPRAIVQIERQYFERIDVGLRRLGVPPPLIEDVRQLLHQRLLSSEQGSAWHLRYNGRGALLRWLHVVATRMAVDVLRREGRLVTIEDAHIEGAVIGEDHETAYLKLHYRGAFKESFQAAFGELSHRDRNVLRYYVLDRLNIEQIGAIYHVHRATVARWIAGARQHLLDETRRRMLQTIKGGVESFESVMRLIESELEASVGRLLAEEAARDRPPDR